MVNITLAFTSERKNRACVTARDHDLLERANLTLYRQSEIEGIYFSQTSVIYFCRGFRCSKHMSSRAEDCTSTKGFTVKETN